MKTALLLLALSGIGVFGTAANIDAVTKLKAKLLAPATYDNTIIPKEGSPLMVHNNLMVRRIDEVDTDEMSVSMQVTLRQQWLDPRLKYDAKAPNMPEFITLTDHNDIWHPDTFFRNEISATFHDTPVENSYVRIFPDGEVLWSTRLSLKLACTMQLRMYPFDSQICPVEMASYGFAKNDMVLEWKKQNPVQVDDNSDDSLDGYSLKALVTNDGGEAETTTGAYSSLRVDIWLEDQSTAAIVFSLYIPLAMFVFVCWMTLFLDPRAAFMPRLLTAVFCLMAGSGMCAFFKNDIPQVSYTMSIDIWCGFCITFMFIAVLMSVIVHFVMRVCNASAANTEPEATSNGVDPGLLETSAKAKMQAFTSRFHILDLVFIPLYFFGFLLFIIIYCCVEQARDMEFPTGKNVHLILAE